MAQDLRKFHRVPFERGFDTWIMGIDGTWKLRCTMKDASKGGAKLVVDDVAKVLSKEFFLLLSSTGLAYRRCQLAWVNGDQVGVKFLKSTPKFKGSVNQRRDGA